MNWWLIETDILEWKTKGKTTLIQKDPVKGNHHKQVQTQNVPTDVVENTNCINKRDLLFTNKSKALPRETEKMLHEDQRDKRATLHWSAHPQGEQNKTKKPSYGMDWQKKGKYGHAKLDNKQSKNVQDIWQSLSRISWKTEE